MLAIDHEEIRKGNRNQTCYGAWTIFAFLEREMNLIWIWFTNDKFWKRRNETTQRITKELISSSSCQDMDTSRTFISQVRVFASNQ